VSAPAPAVRVRGLDVRFGERRALAGVDLEVPVGQFVALAGPNGSGKSTLLRCMLGFLEPDRGAVALFGDPVGTLTIRERARRAAWVPQSEVLRDDVRLLDYVQYGRYPYHGPLDADTESDREIARRALGEVGLLDRARDGILEISGGERQRAVLARALAQEAPLLLLDEPTTHLDIAHQIDLLSRVRRLATDGRVTVVAALHDLNLAARYADRIVVLSRGRRVADGTPAAVLSTDLLARVWGVDAELGLDRTSGLPFLIPRRLVDDTPPATASLTLGPVHVVGGGGAAAPLLRALVDAGFRVTAGALNMLDTDAETAEALGVVAAVEGPFAPLGPAVRERHRALLAEARAIVVAPFAVGPTNLANLDDVRPFVGRTATFLVRPAAGVSLDFAGGAATAARSALVEGGALEVDDLGGAVRAVSAALAPARAPTGAAATAEG
jgi:iron complex transport system ATP-binding protein